jgi:molybdate transport repressor ModE-like protein
MNATLGARRNRRLSIRPRVKFWLELDDERAFCPGVYRILKAVERTGSIKDAAAEIGRSYRFVWGKLKQVERALGAPLVETRVGGKQEQRSVLTPLGALLIQEFENLRQQLFDLVDRKLTPRLQSAVDRLVSSRRR